MDGQNIIIGLVKGLMWNQPHTTALSTTTAPRLSHDGDYGWTTVLQVED